MSRLVFGLQSVREAVRAHGDRMERLFVERDGGPKLEALARFAEGRGVAVEALSRAELDRRAAGGRHQGAMALAPELGLVAVADLAVDASSLVVALDGVIDPQNFGAVIRSAVALGASAIVWPEHASAPLSPATFRASAGAIEHAVLCRVPSLPEALDTLAGRGLTAVALDAQGPVELRDLDLRGPVVIVIGAEDKGTRRPVRRACKYTARLPMKGPISSLNASVAGAIALYEVQRQRSAEARDVAASPVKTDRGPREADLRAAWAIVAAAVPVHLALALVTDLSPDEAYYLCAARLGSGGIVDHPPLTLWLLALSDRWSAAPVELRVRVWAILFSFITGMACVALARARGAGPAGCTLAAWIGSWALLPMAGGFVTTPDGPLLAAVSLAFLASGPGGKAGAVAGLSLLVGALGKVVAVPIGALLAASSRRATLGARLAMVGGPLLALPLLLPSLRFQLHHAYGEGAPNGWSLGGAAGALVAAGAAQAALWSPLVLWRGLRGLGAAPRPIARW